MHLRACWQFVDQAKWHPAVVQVLIGAVGRTLRHFLRRGQSDMREHPATQIYAELPPAAPLFQEATTEFATMKG